MPLNGLPSHTLNLRQNLIRAVLAEDLDEDRLILSAKARISARIPDLLPPSHRTTGSPQQTEDFVCLSHTVKCDLARWMRRIVISHLESENQNLDNKEVYQQKQALKNNIASIISLDHFWAILHILEDLEDFAILADILCLLSSQVRGPVLTAVTDTANIYFDIFNAIGAGTELFQKLYRNVEGSPFEEFDKAFFESLIDFGCRLSDVESEIRTLRKRMSTQSSRVAAAASSPISDTMVEAVQSTDSVFADEMDHMFASGTSMDKQTLSRVFETFIGHLEKSLGGPSHLIRRYCNLFVTLRGYGPKSFDVLLNEWLSKWMQSSASRKTWILLLKPMICFELIPLAIVLRKVTHIIQAESDLHLKCNLALESLTMIAGVPSERMSTIDYRQYRIRRELEDIVLTDPAAVVDTIRAVVAASQVRDPSIRERAETALKNGEVVDLAKFVFLQQTKISQDAAPTVSAYKQFCDADMILYSIFRTPRSNDIRTTIASILDDINEFNMSMFKVEFEDILAANMKTAPASTELLPRIIFDRLRNASAGHVDLWAYLVFHLPASQAILVMERAEEEVLDWAAKDVELTLSDDDKHIPSFIAIIEASAFCVQTAEASPTIERITDILICLLQKTGLRTCEHQRQRSHLHRLLQRLEVLFRLLILHQTTIRHPGFSQIRLLYLFTTLSLLLQTPLLASHPVLSLQLLDVLSILTLSVSDNTRCRCIHILRDSHNIRDPRLCFIFGYTETSESEWLQITNKPLSPTESRLVATIGMTTQPFLFRRWEMMQDATPIATENDTSISLTLFGSRKTVL